MEQLKKLMFNLLVHMESDSIGYDKIKFTNEGSHRLIKKH